jgi:hypothetical protein
MDLTLTEGCWIECCMYLTKVMCLNNYYSLFYYPSYKSVHDKLSTARAIPPYSKYN